MENFKFITDRTPLTPEEIHSHKDFNKVLNQYKNVPVKFYKTGWFKAGLATVTVAATGLIVFFATGPDKNNDSSKVAKAVTNPSPYADETPCVKSPAPSIDVPQVDFTVNANRDTVLRYETGSVILFKANSLKNEDGSNVSGKVVIHYREFHNPVEIFASGIPMQYDSAGVDWHLKSAGMIELTAEQNGKPVFLAPEKPMDIQMKSSQNDGEYNVYFLDTNKRNWSFEGVDNCLAKHKTGDTKAEIPKNINVELAKSKVDEVKIKNEMTAELPKKPVKADPKAFTFALDVLESEFPELAVYGTTKFEVIDDEKSFNNQVYSTDWEDASLKEIIKGEKYKMTLTRGNVVKSFTVIPVLEGKDYVNALNFYNKKYKEYETKLAARIKDEKDKIEAEKQKLAKWEKQAKENHEKYIEDLTASTNAGSTVNTSFVNGTHELVTRAFTVSKFGYWNCDNPKKAPDGEKVMAHFLTEEGKPIILTQAFLCEKKENMIYTYNPEDFKKFKFDARKKNIIWGMTKDGRLAYGLEETFANNKVVNGKLEMKLKVMDEPLTDVKKIRKLFGI